MIFPACMTVRFVAAGTFVAMVGCTRVPSARIELSEAHPQSFVEAVRVADPTTGLYQSICWLNTERKAGYLVESFNTSTGFLISPDFLATAAHNVHSPFFNRIVSGDVQCGRRDSLRMAWRSPAPFTWRDQHDRKWYNFGDFRNDFAGVHLAGAPSFRPAFRLSRTSDSPLTVADTVYVAGFPSDSAHGMDGQTMFEAKGRLSYLDNEFLCYNFRGAPGLSGAPVWTRRGSDLVVIGIHIAGTVCNGKAQLMARRIRPEEAAEFYLWMSDR